MSVTEKAGKRGVLFVLEGTRTLGGSVVQGTRPLGWASDRVGNGELVLEELDLTA